MGMKSVIRYSERMFFPLRQDDKKKINIFNVSRIFIPYFIGLEWRKN